jgi:hypothetical protein
VNIYLSRVGKAVVVVLWITALAVTLTGRNNHRPPAATKSVTTSRSTSVSKAGKTAAAKRGARHSKEAKPPAADILAERVKGFISAYYLIRPDDTPLTRRSRVAPYIAKEALPLLDLGLSGGTAADRARVSQQLTQTGKAVVSRLSSGKSVDDPNTWRVNVPVVVSITRPSRHKPRSFAIFTASLWRLEHGRWFLVNFDKGGGDAG